MSTVGDSSVTIPSITLFRAEQERVRKVEENLLGLVKQTNSDQNDNLLMISKLWAEIADLHRSLGRLYILLSIQSLAIVLLLVFW